MVMFNMIKVGDFKNMHMIGKSFPYYSARYVNVLPRERQILKSINKRSRYTHC